MSDYLSLRANKKLDKDKDMDEKTSSMITFISFILFGLIPLLTFIILLKMNQKNIFMKSLFATMLSLFILGSYQSKITKENYIKLGLTTSFHGLLASVVSYNIGKMFNFLSSVINSQSDTLKFFILSFISSKSQVCFLEFSNF